MAQQITSSPASLEELVENPPVLGTLPNTQTFHKSNAGAHKITKIINPKSNYYICDECNTAYRNLKQVMDDHPEFNIKNLIEYTKPKETRFVF